MANKLLIAVSRPRIWTPPVARTSHSAS